MTKLYNLNKYKFLRRKLRRDITAAEKILWRRLRANRFGFKFRRQFGIGKYIVDFYCPQLKLAIEIDGATHGTEDELERDKTKEDFLISLGVKLKRYLNVELKNCPEGVLEDLEYYIKSITSP